MGNLDDAAAGPAAGPGSHPRRARAVRIRVRAGLPRLDHEGPHGDGGYPQDATADKGEYLFATYAAGVVKLLEQVIAWDGKSWEMP